METKQNKIIIIVIVAAVAVSWYMFIFRNTGRQNLTITEEKSLKQAENRIQELETINPTDTRVTTIEKELTNTNLNDLDKELSNIDKELSF